MSTRYHWARVYIRTMFMNDYAVNAVRDAIIREMLLFTCNLSRQRCVCSKAIVCMLDKLTLLVK